MSSDIAISVRDVGKAYRIWATPASRIAASVMEAASPFFPGPIGRGLRHQAASRYRDFWALQNVSFSVRRGEAVGIIGRNGSGKSTLLQIMAGTMRPTTGDVHIAGRIAALLELGSGFNPEFTGRENVFLNGSVLGLSRREITALFDEIAAFADIGDFIDQPVKTYSSGMIMRLAFSVQTAVNPDVLIVDEALAVGDAQFIAKCIKRISDFLRQGGTLLFVAHDLGIVKQLTTRCLFLDKSRQVGYGDTGAIVAAYADSFVAVNESQNSDRYSAEHTPYAIAETAIARADGTGTAAAFAQGESVAITVALECRQPGPGALLYSIYNYLGIIVCSGRHELPPHPSTASALHARLVISKLRLAPGTYRINFAVRNQLEILSWARNAVYFQVIGEDDETYVYREDTSALFHFQ